MANGTFQVELIRDGKMRRRFDVKEIFGQTYSLTNSKRCWPMRMQDFA